MSCAGGEHHHGWDTCAACISDRRRAAAAVGQAGRRRVADRRREDIAAWLESDPALTVRGLLRKMRAYFDAVDCEVYPCGWSTVEKDARRIRQSFGNSAAFVKSPGNS